MYMNFEENEKFGIYQINLDLEAICTLSEICYEQTANYQERVNKVSSLSAKQHYLDMKAKCMYLQSIFNLMRETIENGEGL